MDFTEKTISTREIYNGRIVHLVEDTVLLPDGRVAGRELILHNGGVGVIALDEDKNVLMVSQYRKPYDEMVLEVPAGKLEKGEDPFVCGVRELKEEVGATAKEVVSLGHIYPTPGYVSEKIYLYLAKGLSFGENHLDEGEQLSVEKFSMKQALEMVKNGQIVDAKTIIALCKVAFLMNEAE